MKLTDDIKHIGCYRSTDLARWTRLPNVLTSSKGTALDEGMVIERPRVLYNAATGTYVMYLHYDVRLRSLVVILGPYPMRWCQY